VAGSRGPLGGGGVLVEWVFVVPVAGPVVVLLAVAEPVLVVPVGDVVVLLGVVALPGVLEVVLCDPPHPAASSANATATSARRLKVGRLPSNTWVGMRVPDEIRSRT
jgi:hypothetical protein